MVKLGQNMYENTVLIIMCNYNKGCVDYQLKKGT
jgi:hypothetical protein